MTSNGLQRFFAAYVIALHEAMQCWPAEYGLTPETTTDEAVARTANGMLRGFTGRTYNKDGRAVRLTCKRLGIAHTYVAINRYLDGAAV